MKKTIFTISALILTLSVLCVFTSCNLFKKNTEKEDADLPYATPPTMTAEPFEVIDSNITLWKDSGDTIWGKLIVEVKNTSKAVVHLKADDFDLADQSGKIAETMQMVSVYPEIIQPGETAVYYSQTEMKKISDENLHLKIIDHITPVESKNQQVLFPVTDVKLTDIKDGGIKATGKIENNTTEEQDFVYAAVICRDSKGKALTVLLTILEKPLEANGKADFEASSYSLPKEITADNIKSFDAYAYPSQEQF